MGKKTNKCVICGGLIKFDEYTGEYKCLKCNANYDANLLKPAKNVQKPKKGKFKLNSCAAIMAIIMTLYLLWFIYRRV